MEESAEQPLIEIQDLWKIYADFPAVRGLHLRVFPGEIYGFLGPNGAGKTSTLKMLAGLSLPTRGFARLCGFDVVREGESARRNSFFIPDRPYLYERLTPWEYLCFLADLYALAPEKSRPRAEELLELFGLAPVRDQLMEGFSHGMKQKVVLSGAFLVGPKVLLVDEPMVGLDPPSVKKVKDLFRAWAAQGNALLLSTHTLEVAEKICDRIGILHHGRLKIEGTIEELRRAAHRREADLETLFLEWTSESGEEKS